MKITKEFIPPEKRNDGRCYLRLTPEQGYQMWLPGAWVNITKKSALKNEPGDYFLSYKDTMEEPVEKW